MTGQDVIKFIQENHLEDANVTVTATMYYNGDHDCRTTNEVSISEGSERVKIEREWKRPAYKSVPTIDFYIDSELY